MRCSFNALIKNISTRSLVSGDKATRLLLEYDSNNMNETLNDLNVLQRGDKSVAVVIYDGNEK